MGALRGAVAILSLGVAFACAGASRAAAQQAPDPEQTAAPATSAAADSAMAGGADSSMAAVADSLAGSPTGFVWFTSLQPLAKATWYADVSRAYAEGSLTASLDWLDGAKTGATLTHRSTRYRQLDRDSKETGLNGNLSHELHGRADLKMDFFVRRSEDQNHLRTGEDLVLKQDNEQARMTLEGGSAVVEGIQQRWVVLGQFEKSRQENRGTRNNRDLLKGGFSSRWIKTADDWSLRGKFGLLGETGTRQLLGFEAHANARSDTLGIALDADLPDRWTLSVSVDRWHSVEERLDLARNSSGLIDTTGVARAKQAGQERESVASQSWSLDLDGRPWNLLSVNANAGHDFDETQYVFSPQGIVQNGRNALSGGSGFRYAPSGSLRTQLSYEDRYNDRRTRDSKVFRGRESRRSKEFRIGLDQHLFSATDLNLTYRETLSQNVNEEASNKNDRDLLVSRGDAEVKTEAIPMVSVTAGGTYSVKDDLNIDAERVGNNKRDRLIEVRGSYTVNPNGTLQWLQSYRLQIVYVDLFASNDRDQFNKQAQLRNEISYISAAGPSVRFEYLVDFRRNGTRDVTDLYRKTYRTNLRRFDHQLTAKVSVPVKGMTLEALTKRGYLREERGTRKNDEDRGEIHLHIEGQHRMWQDRATISLNLERILQFGPRVREEAEDYWRANSTITVNF